MDDMLHGVLGVRSAAPLANDETPTMPAGLVTSPEWVWCGRWTDTLDRARVSWVSAVSRC